MRGGVVVGTQGEGGRRMSIPDSGGVRWSLVGTLRIGERVVASCEVGWIGSAIAGGRDYPVGLATLVCCQNSSP